MTWKGIVGARFSPAEFDDYVSQLVLTAWRPQFVVVHNTGIPSLANKPVGYTQAEMPNLEHYYRDTQGWSAGPHCFVDQNGIWVFTPLTTSGVHSPSWNAVSWGVEALGDYSTEVFADPIREHLVACLATLHAVPMLDVNGLRFHREDPLTNHVCPGVNINKTTLIHDVQQLMVSRQTLVHPASGRYTDVSPADTSPQSHFFTDHAVVQPQTSAIAYGPVISNTPADKETKFRVTSLFKAVTDVNAYAIVTGFVMLQRVTDAANPNSYLPEVVNLVIKPYKQAMLGFTPVKYFIYRNLRLDNFLKGISNADEKLIRAQAGASPFIQNLWTIHTAQNGAVAFESKVLGYDPANQPGSTKIDNLFYRENANQQLPFVARGDNIGKFHANAGSTEFGLEIILEESEFQPDYNYVRKYKEVLIDVSGMPTGSDKEKFTIRLEREKILNYIDPAAFFGMHMAKGGWLQVNDGAGNRTKLTGVEVYDNVVTKFDTKNTLYLDIRNENGFSLNFYGKYDDGSGNALEVGRTSASLTAQPYASDKWPLIICKSTPEATTNDYSGVFVRLRLDYNKRPILYLQHGQPDGPTTNGRFIADSELVAAATDPTTKVIGFRFANKDLGTGDRIGVAWMLKMDYAMRLDAANTPFPPEVVPTETHFDNLFGPIDVDPLWATSHPVIAWLSAQERKYVDGQSIAALGFEHVADRGLAFSQWTNATSATGSVLFYAAAKDSFANGNKNFVPQNGLTSGVSNRDSFFEVALLFDNYTVGFGKIADGPTQVLTVRLKEKPPNSRPPEAMLLLGLARSELDTRLKPLAGFDSRYPRNLLLREVTGSPFTDVNGSQYRKYKVGLSGMNDDGKAHQALPSADVIVYTSDEKLFFSKAFTDALPQAQPQTAPVKDERNFEEGLGLYDRPGRMTYLISGVSGTDVTVTVPQSEPPIDLAREIVPDDEVTIKGVGYKVLSVSAGAANATITLAAAPAGVTPGTDSLRVAKKALEDYFIAKDRLGAIPGSPDSMAVLVNNFASGLSGIPDGDPTAPILIEALINDYGPKTLQRARYICSAANFAYPDDRILYWARIKMMVKLKNHPYLRRAEAADEKIRLVKLLETKSRGFDGVTFAAAPPGHKKVLITGFDPFQIPLNKERSNAAGAASLALHGQNHTLNGVSIHIQSAIFPNRYEDFGKQSSGAGVGVVENFFEQFINPALPGDKPDIIVTLSLGGILEFWVDRFASRARGGVPDNMNESVKLFPSAVDGEQFYETTLPETKIVPADNKCGDFKVFYNNYFWYEWNHGLENAKYPLDIIVEKRLPQPDSGTLKIEDPNHPEHNFLTGEVPTMLSANTTPTKDEITARRGSGGHYFSNEIFYRVSRLRTKHNPSMITGHYHVPVIQHSSGEFRSTSAVNSSVHTSVYFDAALTRNMIEEIRDALVQAAS